LVQRADEARRLDRTEVDRRTVVVKGAATAAASAAALVGAGLAAGIGRLAGSSSNPGTPTLGQGAAGPSPAPPTTATTTPAGPIAPSTTAPAHPPGTRIGPASAVPVGGSAAFTDPSSQDPSLVVQPQAGTFLAFDAVCPHAGCTVQYDSASKLFICPCHGSEFNASTGAVEVGPASHGLTRLTVAKGGDGQLYIA
jgi:thiosulfate dehydrogenase [quinone] large subunit